jgi:hypothetical protein
MKQEERHNVLKDSHLEKIKDLIQDMEFGNITIIVQDGKIVQIDKTEKHRIKN